MTDPHDTAEGDDLLAAEYVLGVLALSDRAGVEARLKTDRALAARVAAWETQLSALNDGFAPAPAAPDLLPRIEARLFPQPRRWRAWVGGALTAAALSLAALVLLPLPPPAPLVASLGAPDAPLRFEARHDGAALILTRTAGAAAPAGQAHEAWLIAPDAAPVALGLITDVSLRVPYPAAPEGWVLAVSLEPAGGAPGGAPTGPILATGTITGF